MKLPRRQFLSTAAAGSVGAGSLLLPKIAAAAGSATDKRTSDKNATDNSDAHALREKLTQAGAKPVLQTTQFKDPIIIDSVELLQNGKDHFVRVRSTDGAEGISVDNGRMDVLAPVFQKLIAPFFVGKDARDLEEQLFQAYRHGDNYKFQGLALWCPVAMFEFAVLDMLGRISKQSLGQLLGGVQRDKIQFYFASGRRDTTPEQEIDYLQSLIAKTGARAVKYRVGGRMSRNEDALPGRTDGLIPLSRKVLGDKFTILADANSSYDPPQAIEVGRMLESIGAIHFEEPCPFDNFADTKAVADALDIPVALGEQESSHWRYLDQIAGHVADIVQPDLYYYGGMLRSIRVARMAEAANLPMMPHLSGGFGFVYQLHFCSCIPNISPWQEYKNGVEKYGAWFHPPLRTADSHINVPTAPGLGLADPQSILRDATPVKS